MRPHFMALLIGALNSLEYVYFFINKIEGRNWTALSESAIREQVVEFPTEKRGTQQEASAIFSMSHSSVEKSGTDIDRRGETPY